MFIYGIYGNLILVVTTHNLAKYTHQKYKVWLDHLDQDI